MNSWLKQFGDADGVGERLRSDAPAAVAPEGLHDDIMCSIRTAAAAARRRQPRSTTRWIPAIGFAGIAVAIVIALSHRPEDLQPLNAPAVALRETQSLAQVAPVAALSPLNEELESVQRDLHGAIQFVLASVP